jgi:hypothetical protein
MDTATDVFTAHRMSGKDSVMNAMFQSGALFTITKKIILKITAAI